MNEKTISSIRKEDKQREMVAGKKEEALIQEMNNAKEYEVPISPPKELK